MLSPSWHERCMVGFNLGFNLPHFRTPVSGVPEEDLAMGKLRVDDRSLHVFTCNVWRRRHDHRKGRKDQGEPASLSLYICQRRRRLVSARPVRRGM